MEINTREKEIKRDTDMSFSEKTYLVEVVQGLAVTLGHLIRNLKDPGQELPTVQYPEEERPLPSRYRGLHRLTKRENGDPRCVACMLCQTACPSDCIHIEEGEHPDPSIEKWPEEFFIDELRCVFCGLCVEACPEDAIRMDTGVYELAAEERTDFIFDKERLLDMN